MIEDNEPKPENNSANNLENNSKADAKTFEDDEIAKILDDITPPQETPEQPQETPEQDVNLAALKPEEQVRILQDTIVNLKETMTDMDDEILRYAAELQNTRRRAEKDRQDALKYGMTSFARDMVTVGDNLTRALNACEASDREGLSENMVNLLEGIGATERDLIAALQRNNVKPLNPMGEKFDANFHEAMYEVPDTGQENGTIIEVIEIGFIIGERLLRAAKVGIAKG